MRQRPWVASPEVRLAAAVATLVIAAGAAAFAASRGGSDGPDAAVTIASPTPTPTPTAAAATTPLATVPPVTATPPPEATEPRTEPTHDATSEPAPLAIAQPTPIPPLIDLRPAQVGNGETMLVWVHAPGAADATLEFSGASYSLLQAGEVFWGLVGVPSNEAPGSGTLAVTTRSATGDAIQTEQAEYEVVAVERPVDYVTLTVEQASVLTAEASQRERELRALQFAQFDRSARWTTFFRRPVDGPITTAFGSGRSYNGGPVGSLHTGTDFAGGLGVPVIAAAPGRVAWVGEMPIRGNAVIVDHGAGVKSGYHHLDSISVAVGDAVEAGQQLGEMGESGLATGPHLHWEVTVWGVNVDPMSWIVKDFTP